MKDMKRIIPILLVLLLLPMLGVRADGEEKLMQTGDRGEEVVRVQTRLFDLGYYTYKPTGSFQTVTKAAVISYQSASGLMSDGSVGQETMAALFSGRAKRIPFHAEVPLTFSAQGPILRTGTALSWERVRLNLHAGETYLLRNAATDETVSLVFVSGENHAEMTLPDAAAAKAASAAMLSKWLGTANSFYKCAVLFELDGQQIAASIQWNGEDRVCVYFSGSLSHVGNYPDVEHEANIKKVSR